MHFNTVLGVILLVFIESVFLVSVSDSNSLVVSSTESAKENEKQTEIIPEINPSIYSMHIQANISNRFVRNLITSNVRNSEKISKETIFSVILPDDAFISEFEMEISGKVYKAYVKEKKEAKEIYNQAVSRGQSAAHVELNARDSKTFTVSVNVEPESKTIFRLVYEELLQRINEQYELVINIHPGQIVEDLSVQVNINESKPLKYVQTPSLRTGNEITKNDENLKPSTEITKIDPNSAIVTFNPDKNQQQKFAESLGGDKGKGLAGQFIVQYDVERDSQGGEVLLKDGYFVHFFAPEQLEVLPKHIVFVLDHSGSMSGHKFQQLVEAMKNILSELNNEDVFNIVRFADFANVWNIETNRFELVNVSENYGSLEPLLKKANLPHHVHATPENIEKAKSVIADKTDMGLTNIIAGLEVGLFLNKRAQESVPNKYQPMIIFLTDGLANIGVSSSDEITEITTNLNSGENRVAIFSLSFGLGADKKFLRQLSQKNQGFSRHIYEAADASLQLQNFYKTISSPLLRNITFKYVDGVSDVTRTHYPIFFKGSEIVVAGRIDNISDVVLHIDGFGIKGPIPFNATRNEPVSSLERLWAYLTVKQMLGDKETVKNSTELTKKALNLALKYSFVTSVTSLVVVKPNETDSVDSKPADTREGMASAPSGLQNGYSFPARMPGSAYSPIGRRLIQMPRFGAGTFYYRPSGQNVMMAFIGHRQPQTTPFMQTQRFTTELIPVPVPKISNLPVWLEQIKNNNGNITTPQGTYKLRSSSSVTNQECHNTPNNSTGVCTSIFDCPRIYPQLTTIDIYLKYFCPINEFAGVCCPTTINNVKN